MNKSKIDPRRAVRVIGQALASNPDFAGLIGRVDSVRDESFVVFFEERGASSVWQDGLIENVPDPADEYEALAERAAKADAAKEFPFDFYAAASPETRATIESDPQAFQQRVRDYAYGIAMNEREVLGKDVS